jgi:hypothetical protein
MRDPGNQASKGGQSLALAKVTFQLSLPFDV